MADNKLRLLRKFAAALGAAYAPIAREIDAVVEALNVTGPDDQLKRYIERIVASLKVVEKKISFEKKLAASAKKEITLNDASAQEILPLLAKQIKYILALEHDLEGAERSPSRDLIFAINRLNSELERLFGKEQALLREQVLLRKAA